MADATFNGLTLIITLPPGQTLVDVKRDLYSAWKRFMLADKENMRFPSAFRGSALSGSIDTGAYFFLQNQFGWRIRPSEENITINFTGNLVGQDLDLPIIIPTIGAFTVLILGLQPITQNVDEIIDQQTDKVTNLQFLIESQRPTHSGFGNIFYWDPVNGSDANVGDTPSRAVKTFAQAQTLATSRNHDVIFITNTTAALLTITERLNITKDNLHIRGPGRNVLFEPVDDADDAIKISGKGVSMSSFSAKTTASGAGRNVFNIDGTTGGNVMLGDIDILASTLNGVFCKNGKFNHFNRMVVQGCADDGMELLDTVNPLISGCQFEFNLGWAMNLLSTDAITRTKFARLSGNMTHHNGPGSVNIGTNTHMTIFDADNYFAIKNGNDLVLDNGDQTHNDLLERGITGAGDQFLLLEQMLAGEAEVSLDDKTVTIYDKGGKVGGVSIAVFYISTDGRIRLRTS